MIARRVGNLRGIGLPRSPHRLALSPVCWGVSDVLGWGHQLDPERVLSEAAAVGEAAITAGPPGFLPDRSDQTKPLLKRHRLRVVAGEVHAILHHHDIRGAELAHIDGHAFQPMFGSTIQGPEDIERLLVGSDAGICLDLGHLMLAGADPIEVLELGVGRIQHVQLNDVDKDLAEQVRDQGEDYVEAVGMGLFKPLGEGIAKVDRVVEELRRSQYRGWYTLRQETRLPTADVRPLGGISRSLEYLLPLLS